MKLDGKNIIIVSNEAWGPVWFSKHNYAWQLSARNTVYFINPPVKFNITNVLKNNLEIEDISGSLKVITYKNVLPVRIEFLRRLNENYIFGHLQKFFSKEKQKELIFWTFDPIRLSSPEKLKPTAIIFHAVDHYLFDHKSEVILAKKADRIFCVSETIRNAYKDYKEKAFTVPHAIPDDEFLPLKPLQLADPTGIFVGTLDLRIDYPYTEYIITHFPKVHFRFIGKINISNSFIDKLLKGAFKNAAFESEKPFHELKYEIQKASFCFLFKDNSLHGNNISSHKMLQYFAQGKPIFCSELSEHIVNKDLICMDNDMKRMKAHITTFLSSGEKPGLAEKRVEYAAKHKFSEILKKIESLLGRQ
jgi:hypothetical protein